MRLFWALVAVVVAVTVLVACGQDEDPAGFEVGYASQSRSGWTVGIGGEYAFTNWLSVFAEYDYYDFGTRSATLVTPGTAAIFDVVDIRERKNVFKAGLNLRWGAGPVVAAY